MPAAAVTPAPIAYIKVVAVKKLVVGFLLRHLSHRSSRTLFDDGCCLSILSGSYLLADFCLDRLL